MLFPAINAAIAPVRGDVDACFGQFQMKGTAFLDFEVPGSGSGHVVNLSGTFGGTAMGMCVLEAARKVQFPKFRLEKQKFRYPIVFK